MKLRFTNRSNVDQSGAIVTLALCAFLVSLSTSIANIALPTLAVEFSASFSEVQPVTVLYLVAITASVILVGRLGDTYGLKNGLVFGLCLFALALLFCATATRLDILILARTVQGLGAAFLATLSIAFMRQVATLKQLGSLMGLLGTVSAFGTATGPSLGGFLIAIANWQAIFWLQFVVALLVMLLAIVFLPVSQVPSKSKTPRLKKIFNKELTIGLVVNAIVAAIMMTTLVVGPFYLGIALKLSIQNVGLVMSIGPIISIVTGIPAGHLVNCMGTKLALMLGLMLLCLGATMLALLPSLMGLSGYVLAIVALTPGYQLFQAANSIAILADSPENQQGTVSGMLAFSRNLGLIAGASGMGTVFALTTGSGAIFDANPSAIEVGFQATFGLAALVLIFAAIIVVRPKPFLP